MVQTINLSSPASVNALASAFEARNRLSDPPAQSQLTTDCEESKRRLGNDLANELWSRLPLSRVAEESGDRGIAHTIRIVTASTYQVQAWYRELREFVPAIAQAATERRGEELTDALRTELSANMEHEMLEQIRYPLPNRSFVDYKFADLSPAEAWTQAHRRLEQACVDFANQVLALFDTLQQKRIVGRIQETSSTCRFTFFRRIAIAATSRSKTEKRMRRDPHFQIPGHPVYLEETFQISDFDIQHRSSQCVHHVRNPVLNLPHATEHPLPPKYSRLIDACPGWMSGFLRILEGELFREERIECDLHTETRTDEKVIESVRRCPAVVFGPYILAGWGELAITNEEQRQRVTQDAAARGSSAKKARLNQLLSFVVAGLAMAIIPLTGSALAATTSIAILLGLIAMALAGNAAHLASAARGRLSASRVILHSTLIGAIVFAVQGLTLTILHGSPPAFGITALFALIACGALAGKVANGNMEESRVS